MRNRIVFAAVCLLATLGGAPGCHTPPILTPPTGPGTSYPCGVSGLVCTTNGAPNGYCCGETQTCGADDRHTKYPSAAEDPTCPSGSCCDDGEEQGGPPDSFEARLAKRVVGPRTRAK